eukprot:6190637-Pleurochrysis_carterae.AAC.4
MAHISSAGGRKRRVKPPLSLAALFNPCSDPAKVHNRSMDNMAATEQTTMATPQECLLQLGAGNFSEERHDWAWTAEATAKCGFGEYDQPAARAMLSGQRLTFIGDSTARRQQLLLTILHGHAVCCIAYQQLFGPID